MTAALKTHVVTSHGETRIRQEVRSPFSGKIILVLDGKNTVRLPNGPCEVAVEYMDDTVTLYRGFGENAERIRGPRKELRAMDPIYFWAAGIFDYDSIATPKGRKAFLSDDAIASFICSFPKKTKQRWKKLVGFTFPYRYLGR